MLKGPRAEGTHIRQIKSTYVTTNIVLWQADKLAMSMLKTPVFIESLLALIVGCNKQQLLLHYLYSKGYIL